MPSLTMQSSVSPHKSGSSIIETEDIPDFSESTAPVDPQVARLAKNNKKIKMIPPQPDSSESVCIGFVVLF